MSYHSVDRCRFSRVFGIKHKKSENSFIDIQCNEITAGTIKVLSVLMHVKDGATIEMHLLGHEAVALGTFLMTKGAAISALQEASYVAQYGETESEMGWKADCSDGVFRSWIQGGKP